MKRGQALVEMALLMVFLGGVGWGVLESARLFLTVAHDNRATDTLAHWAAAHPGEDWSAVAERELPGCDVTVSEPMPGVIEAGSRCVYHPLLFRGWDLLPISSRESAAAAR